MMDGNFVSHARGDTDKGKNPPKGQPLKVRPCGFPTGFLPGYPKYPKRESTTPRFASDWPYPSTKEKRPEAKGLFFACRHSTRYRAISSPRKKVMSAYRYIPWRSDIAQKHFDWRKKRSP